MSQTHLQQLVTTIEKNHPLSPAVRAAFSAVDRAHFVPQYYRRQGKGWIQEATNEHAYQDIPLITQLDHRGWPTSSSSMPSVMAAMVEALDLQPGLRVLEIGAGTGYNAALMAQIVGKTGQIVSIDIDAPLVETARQRIAALPLPWLHVAQTDGFQGDSEHAPYDRIMATAGFRRVPLAWQAQLAAGGIVVGNLLGPLASILLRLQKGEDGSLRGSPLPQGGFFMEMHNEETKSTPPIIDWKLYDVQPMQEHQSTVDLVPLLKEQAFLFYLQCWFGTLQLHMRYNGGPLEDASSYEHWLIDTEQHASLTPQSSLNSNGEWVIQERGHQHLWEQIQWAIQHWEEKKRPALEDYTMTISPQGDTHVKLGGS